MPKGERFKTWSVSHAPGGSRMASLRQVDLAVNFLWLFSFPRRSPVDSWLSIGRFVVTKLVLFPWVESFQIGLYPPSWGELWGFAMRVQFIKCPFLTS